MTEWTKGPWQYFAADGTIWADVPGEGSRASVMKAGQLAALLPRDRDANGRLIAAAPELYEALAEMVETFHGYQGMELTKARAALSRARGDRHG